MNRLQDMIVDYMASGGTLEQLSEVSGVPLQTVKRIRQGTTDNPYMDTVVRIVKAIGGSLDEIFGISTAATVIESATPDVSGLATDNQTVNLSLIRDVIASVQRTSIAFMREREESHKNHVHDLVAAHKQTRKILLTALVCCGLLNVLQLAAFVALYFYDITHPDRGWFQLQQALQKGAALTTFTMFARQLSRSHHLW